MKFIYGFLLTLIFALCLSARAHSQNANINIVCPTTSSTAFVSSATNTAGIQNVINTVPPGTTLIFTPGTYAITSSINLRSGVSLQGQTGTVLVSHTGQSMFIAAGVSDIN